MSERGLGLEAKAGEEEAVEVAVEEEAEVGDGEQES